MATQKKTSNKTGAVKKTPAKARTATVKTSAKGSRSKQTKKPSVKSLKLSKENEPFMTVKVTSQTLYWAILGLVSIVFVVWVCSLQVKIYDVYNQIDEIRASEDSLVYKSINSSDESF